MGRLIGIYGGSFDPIHLGHLNLAAEIMEAHHLDEVWFCPAERSPFKSHQNPVSSAHRLNMVRLAIEHEPRFKVSEIELDRKGLSYTIDTLKELFAIQNKVDDPDTYAIIMGEDAAKSFHQWRDPEAIVKLSPLLIGSRAPDEKQHESFEGSKSIINAIKKGLTRTRIMEISSKEIRKRLSNKKNCYHLVPGKVIDYINANHLYCSVLHKENETRFL